MAWFDFGPLPVTKQCRKCHKTFYEYGASSTCGACPEGKGSVGKRSDDAEQRGDSASVTYVTPAMREAWGLLLLGLVVGVFFGWWIA